MYRNQVLKFCQIQNNFLNRRAQGHIIAH